MFFQQLSFIYLSFVILPKSKSLTVVTSADDRSLDEVFLDGNNAFTAKMFSEVVKRKSHQSVVLSAFSVLTPLAQLALASVGESHDELLATIGMPNDIVTKTVFSRVNNQLKSVKGITLKAASKIYVAKNYELNNEFAALTRDVFGSEVTNVDFNENETTAKKINLWVEEQTNNCIKDLVAPASLNDSTRALLVNAIYFKGLWEIPFNKDSTIDKDFHVSKKKTIQVPTMFNENKFKYVNSKKLNAQVLELIYKGGESAIYIVLPHDVDGIQKLEKKLSDPSLLDKVIKTMQETWIKVYLPKFKIETTTDLKEILLSMNVKKLFNAQHARLDNLLKVVDGELYISDAKQKAFIEVNEEGSEAAAANVFTCVPTSLMTKKPPKPEFVADRPFYFVVKENWLSLFNGVYAGK